MMKVELRDYQRQAIDGLHRAFSGADRPTGSGVSSRAAVVLPTGSGKGHPLDTEVPTPQGLRLWGDLEVGDEIFGANGRPTRVTAIFDRGVLPTWRVTMKHGESVLVDGEHLWQVQRKGRKPHIMSTAQIAAGPLKDRDGWLWSVPVASPVDYPGVELPLHPFVVGSLIANGGMTHTGTILTTPDDDVVARCALHVKVDRQSPYPGRTCPTYSLPGLVPVTRALGMRVHSRDKRVPRAYLEAATRDRVELLEGLMVGDGSVRHDGRRSVLYSTTSPDLAEDVAELVTGLGGTCSIGKLDRSDDGKPIEYSLHILLPLDLDPFSTQRKTPRGTPRRAFRPRSAIVSVEPAGVAPIRCITVSAFDSLYLITRRHIVTHNTVIFAHPDFRNPIIGADRRMLVLVHRDELAAQAVAKVRAIDPSTSVGRVQGLWNETDRQVIVASVQTLARAPRRSLVENVGLVVVDECFPAGTMVGDRPIQTVRVGDLVPSYDEVTGAVVAGRVTATMRKAPTGLVRITLIDGEQFTCTPDHPVMTTDGWCPAWQSRGAQLLSFTHDAIAQESNVDGLCRVRKDLHGTAKGEDRRGSQVRARLLPGLLPGRLDGPGSLGTDGSDQPQTRLGADAVEQSDAPRWSARDDEGNTGQDRTPSGITWRERETRTGATATTCRALGVAHRRGGSATGRSAAISLQAGYRAPVDEGLHRGGREIPLLAGPPSIGSAPGRTACLARVVDVQVLEPGRDGTYGGVCPDGYVYNLEVESTHTYLIGSGLVVHNCHHAVAPTYRKVMEHFGCFAEGGRAVPTAGFTATMTRSAEGEHLGNVWQEVVLRRDVVDGIRDGWLVDVRGRRVEIRGLDLGEVRRSRGDFSERDLGEHMMAADAPEQVAKAYVEEASDRQGIAFWPDLDSADQGAAAFRDHGIVTDVIKGETSIAEREAVYERFRRGQTQMLSSCMVLTEGFDMPQASAAVIARPTQSKGLFVQMAGRVLRPFHLPVPGYPPKRDALLLDVVGATSQHRLATIADLSVAVTGIDDDETLAQAADRETAEAGVGDVRAGVPARHTVHDVDLFGDRSSVWLQTPRGTWFVPAGDYTVFLWPSEHGLWKIGVTLSKAGPGQAQQVADGMTMDWAMERAEAWATDICARTGVGNLSGRRAGWRRGGEASPQQVAYAQGLGARVPPGATKAQVSDLISTALAARALGG